VWVFLTAIPVFIVLANPAATQPGLYWSDIVGSLIWLLGFGIESLADYQKQVFKNANPRDFITTGVFAYSRYPNYFGYLYLIQ
jgi:steroid 5-alpha reductase family enzyme